MNLSFEISDFLIKVDYPLSSMVTVMFVEVNSVTYGDSIVVVKTDSI